jgi:hypothetical protein
MYLCTSNLKIAAFFDLLRQPPTLKAGGIKEKEEKQKEIV